MGKFALRGVMACGIAAASVLSAPTSSQWTTHSESGYTVQMPPGWSASADRTKGWVHLMGTQGEDVVIWPVFIPGAGAVPDLRAAQLIQMKLAAACPYHAEWEAPQAVGPATLRARGKSQNMAAVSIFTWMASPRGAAAYFYVAGAREMDFRQKQGDLARVLGSFRLAGTAGGSGQGGLQFVPFADPNEGAFAVTVPAGWKTAGGLFRVSPFTTRVAVQTDSPDGQTRVILGDAQLPSSFQDYLPGTPAWAVRPPGTNVMGNIVYPYMTGMMYCRYYLQNRVAPFCSDLQITKEEDNAPVAEPAPMAMTPSKQYTTGAVSFTCREEGKPRSGYCEAKSTRSIPPPQIQSPFYNWRIEVLSGYIAPVEEAAQGEAVMKRLRDSFQVNPQWGMREIRGAAQRSEIIRGTAQEIAGMAEASQRYRDAVDDRIARMRSNATLGVTEVVDTMTGRRMSVDSGSGYYWVDNRGMILGTQVDTSPGVDFRRLLELPGQ